MADLTPSYILTLSSAIAQLSKDVREGTAEVRALTQAFGIMLDVQRAQGVMLSEILDRSSKDPAPSKVPAALALLTEAIQANTLGMGALIKAVEAVPAAVESRVATGVYAALHDGELPT